MAFNGSSSNFPLSYAANPISGNNYSYGFVFKTASGLIGQPQCLLVQGNGSNAESYPHIDNGTGKLAIGTFNGSTGNNVVSAAALDFSAWYAAVITVSGGTLLMGSAAFSHSGGTITVSGGHWNQEGAAITMTTTLVFSMTSGTTTATSATWTHRGNFTISGGTFNHSSGTFTVQNSNSSPAIDVGSAIFNNVNWTFDFTSRVIVVTGTWDIDGTLTVSGLMMGVSTGTVALAGDLVCTSVGGTAVIPDGKLLIKELLFELLLLLDGLICLALEFGDGRLKLQVGAHDGRGRAFVRRFHVILPRRCRPGGAMPRRIARVRVK
jgi:hypothetical protein